MKLQNRIIELSKNFIKLQNRIIKLSKNFIELQNRITKISINLNTIENINIVKKNPNSSIPNIIVFQYFEKDVFFFPMNILSQFKRFELVQNK